MYQNTAEQPPLVEVSVRNVVDPKSRAHSESVNIREERLIKERTRKGYYRAVMSAEHYSINKRTTDPEEPALVTMHQVVSDLIERDDLAKSTKSMIRASLIWYVLHSGLVDHNNDTLGAIKLLKSANFALEGDLKRVIPRRIPEKDLSKLIQYLASTSKKNDSLKMKVLVWVEATLCTGLLPKEWLDADWLSADEKALVFEPAKTRLERRNIDQNQKNERCTTIAYRKAHAYFQGLTWCDESNVEPSMVPDSSADIDAPSRRQEVVSVRSGFDYYYVGRQLAYIREALRGAKSPEARQNDFKKYYDKCRVVLAQACKAIWHGKKSYCFYTMHFQFASAAKARGAQRAAKTSLDHRVSGGSGKRLSRKKSTRSGQGPRR